MKHFLLIFFLLLLVGCNKNDINENNGTLNHANLGFELAEPTIILNELANGELKNYINSILLVMYGNTERKWEFEYIGNTDIISKMTFYSPHYQFCEKNEFEFSYNSQNLIDKIISTRKTCVMITKLSIFIHSTTIKRDCLKVFLWIIRASLKKIILDITLTVKLKKFIIVFEIEEIT